MIEYNPKSLLGLGFMWRCRGSVFHKSVLVCLPNAILASLCHYFLHDRREALGIDGMQSLWSGFTFVLGFLVVFRNNQAYSRFWEGAMQIAVMRGEWLNAISSSFAFCSAAKEKEDSVRSFQVHLAKTASLLFASALQQVCDLDDDVLQVLNTDGIGRKSMLHLVHSEVKTEILMQWCERLILDADRRKVIDVSPPVLSRLFQELGNGTVILQKVRNIKEVPFPFPYAQMLNFMLILHWLVSPVLVTQMVSSWWWAGLLCFVLTGSLWSLIHIAIEIDQPFGDDANDLPVKRMMVEFNEALLEMMHPLTQELPSYEHQEQQFLETPYEDWSHAEVHRCTFMRSSHASGMEEPSEAPVPQHSSVDLPCLPVVSATTSVDDVSIMVNVIGADLEVNSVKQSLQSDPEAGLDYFQIGLAMEHDSPASSRAQRVQKGPTKPADEHLMAITPRLGDSGSSTTRSTSSEHGLYIEDSSGNIEHAQKVSHSRPPRLPHYEGIVTASYSSPDGLGSGIVRAR